MTQALPRFVARRLSVSLGLLVLLSLVVYVGVDLLPGDPATSRLGDRASLEQIAAARDRLGVDEPVLRRYAEWASALLQGDLGTSMLSGVRVRSLIADRLGNSALLAGITLTAVIPLSLLVGVWAGVRRGRWPDRVVSTVAVMLVALPEYVFAGLLVLVFAVWLGWFPAVSVTPATDGLPTDPDLLALPILSLLALSLAHAVRVIRAATAAALRAPHVDTARLNGTPWRTILRRAVLPAVLPVAVQIWCVLGVGLVGGAVLVERVYGYPGIGELLVSSVQSGDIPVAQALAMLLGAAMLIAVAAADIAVALTTPWKRNTP
ncbi:MULTISPECIES: ABC transporter permease [Streptomyces]|uniref:ABC transporter permease n=1 Tax=Streptomyces lycopersici TaxID=2974589 RepID=UPI0021CFB490|nr:ABC transporter permease [Streptomyces sp. NEAU-383]